MRYFALLWILFLSVTALVAGNEAILEKWECEAIVDMTYPFSLEFAEEGGKLTGTITGDQGTTPLTSIQFADGKLTFEFDYPPAGGIIDFEAKVQGESINGTLGNDMFIGDFSCRRPK